MTQEEKQVLLNDICARLPYGVKVSLNKNNIGDLTAVYSFDGCAIIENLKEKVRVDDFSSSDYGMFTIDENDVKPYLRPISSMTEEEKRVLNSFAFDMGNKWFDAASNEEKWLATIENSTKSTDYLYSKHLDIHGLIEKGLALEAPEGMYKTK